MTDNPRPSLYQAKYEAALANRMQDQIVDHYRIAGKCCESGDILIQEIALPEAKPEISCSFRVQGLIIMR